LELHLQTNTTKILKLWRNTGRNIVVEEGEYVSDRREGDGEERGSDGKTGCVPDSFQSMNNSAAKPSARSAAGDISLPQWRRAFERKGDQDLTKAGAEQVLT